MKLIVTEDEALQASPLTDSAFLHPYVKTRGIIQISNLSTTNYNLLLDLLNHPKVVFRDPKVDEDWLDDSMLTLHKTNFALHRISGYVNACEYVIISGINLTLALYPSNEVLASIDVFTVNSEYFKPRLDTYYRHQIIDEFLADN